MTFAINHPIKTLVIFGLLLRIFVVFFYSHINIFPDSGGYIELAKLLSESNLSGYHGQRSPGYPMLLVLANNQLFIAIVIQLLIGILTSVLVHKNFKLLNFSARTALLYTLFLNSFLHVIFYEISILTESLTLFFIMLICNLLLKRQNKNTYKKWLILSLLFAYLVLIKPFYIFLPFLVYGFSVFKNFDFRKIFGKDILILLFPLVAFTGWSYVNKVNTGYFVPTTFYGYNLAQNCVWFAEKSPEDYRMISDIYVRNREESVRDHKNVSMAIWESYDELKEKTGLSFADLSAELNNFSRATIKANPTDYLKQVFTSWLDFWKTDISWKSDFFRFGSATVFAFIWDLQHYVLRLFKVAFLLNIPFLCYIFIRKRKITPEIVFATFVIITSFLQAFATYGTNSRFSFPLEFLMVMVVALQIKRIHLTFKNRKN